MNGPVFLLKFTKNRTWFFSSSGQSDHCSVKGAILLYLVYQIASIIIQIVIGAKDTDNRSI